MKVFRIELIQNEQIIFINRKGYKVGNAKPAKVSA